MAIRKVARMGHPVLRQKARKIEDVEFRSEELARLIADMRETMEEYGGIGIAAPQVHVPLQVALIGIDAEGEGCEAQDAEVFINPVITVLDEKEQGFWEGCLSVPDLRGLVFRPRKIRVDYRDEKGKSRSIEAEGFRATVFQHELDHLAGILYVDRIKDTTHFSFLEEYERYWARAVRESDSDIGELAD